MLRNEIVINGAAWDRLFAEPRDDALVSRPGARFAGSVTGRADRSESGADVGAREGVGIAESGNSISRNDSPGPWPTPLARKSSPMTSAARISSRAWSAVVPEFW